MKGQSLQDWCKENNRPNLLEEWNYNLNTELSPNDIMPLSNKKVWWRCKKHHEWQATVNNRTKGTGCPYCSGRYPIRGENDLATICPKLVPEWHPTKNGALKPCDVKAGSGNKVWWRCVQGHEWEAVIRSRALEGTGCPYCLEVKASTGVNDLQTLYPKIAEEWNFPKNGILKPSDFRPMSGKKVWWKCHKGHEWKAVIYSRVNGCGCPVCSNHKVLVGYNDLETTFPAIAKEWHPTRNGPIRPMDVSYGNDKKVWWKCFEGHEWKASISLRTARGRGCPYCSGRYAITGVNDLQTVNPDLAKEWHPTRNGNLRPRDVKNMSNTRVWWRCYKGHEWQVSPASRVFQKTGCPICSNKKVLVGYNDLATTHPELANEWDFEKNGNLKPTDITYGCTRGVWWKCKYGHEWKTTPNTRTNGRTGCPLCFGKGSSLPEQGISFYLEPICEIGRRVKISGQEIDIYLPEYKVGIEYDGRYYHPTSGLIREQAKDRILSGKGIYIIRIKEADTNNVDEKMIYYKADNMHSNYDWAVKQLCCMLATVTDNDKFAAIDIDVKKDLRKIRERFDLYDKDNSLAVIHPELAAEWNYDKNGVLTPEMVYAQSNKSVWWIGKCGHEWEASPNNRVNGENCPFCSNQRILKGFNDLQTIYPHLASEWNYEKNRGLLDGKGRDISTPDKIAAKSGQNVWWKCCRGHEWMNQIHQRVRGDGCPYCSGRRVIKGETDLLTLFPSIAEEWHAAKNGNLHPSDITANYSKPVWWRCAYGHEWRTSPNNRISGNTGCPYCFRKRVGKRIRNVDTNQIYDNARLAAESCGLKSGSGVAQCCRGKREMAGGFHWEFMEG